jgi:hypothetical protein
MALTAEVVDRVWTDIDRVVEETTRQYLLRREPVEAMMLADMVTKGRVADVPCVVAVQQRIVEAVVDDVRHLAPLVSSAWHLESQGWRVTVLAPLSLMGDAHRLLRGAPVLLQPWWIDESAVLYGSFERP